MRSRRVQSGDQRPYYHPSTARWVVSGPPYEEMTVKSIRYMKNSVDRYLPISSIEDLLAGSELPPCAREPRLRRQAWTLEQLDGGCILYRQTSAQQPQSVGGIGPVMAEGSMRSLKPCVFRVELYRLTVFCPLITNFVCISQRRTHSCAKQFRNSPTMGAPKGNKFAKRNRGGGRPTLYKPNYAEIARRMCTQGATRADLADRFGVTINTIMAWQLENEEFFRLLQAGREAADERVEQKLLRARRWLHVRQRESSCRPRWGDPRAD